MSHGLLFCREKPLDDDLEEAVQPEVPDQGVYEASLVETHDEGVDPEEEAQRRCHCDIHQVS